MTYFENLETLLQFAERSGTDIVAISDVRNNMIKDQHYLFHDAEFHDGCIICDHERAEYS